MPNAEKILKYLLITNILIILIVYYIEYIMGIYACNLCKYQRVPVFINIFLLSILIINKKKFFKLLYILILSITINIMISTYHIGIEQNIFSESKICTSKDNILNKDELLKQLEKKNDAGCSKVTFKLFGLSLSMLNFFTNIVFLILCVHILRNEKK